MLGYDDGGQSVLKFTPVASSAAPTASAPPDPTTCYLAATIVPKWSPPSANVQLGATIPSTRNWTQVEMQFFKLSYFQVQYLGAAEYICPLAPLTKDMDDIIKSQLSLSDFLNGLHLQSGSYGAVAEFGDAILRTVIPPVAEPVTDALTMSLLKFANCNYINLFPFPQRGQFEVTFGTKSFVSIPDASMVYRVAGKIQEGPTFIIVEDKQLGVDDGEYQIPGEMLAVAFRNFLVLQLRFSQTIFAMRVIGSHATFYRADFPASYLTSIQQGVRPVEHVTIFRIGGDRAKVTKRTGLKMTDHGEQRVKAFNLLCSIVSACDMFIRPDWVAKKEPQFTATRVQQMSGTYAS